MMELKGYKKIAIIGSRGIPPKYGGTETFVYELSKRIKAYFDVYVTCETNKFYIDEFDGIKRVHIPSLHISTLTIPSIHDIIATLYLLKVAKDIRLYYYVAPDGALAALIAKLARRKVVINTDGVEWRRLLIRAKYVSRFSRILYYIIALYMLFMEFLSTKIADVIIADALGIKHHLKYYWNTDANKIHYIPYGTYDDKFSEKDDAIQKKIILEKLGLKPYEYYLIIGRIIPENGFHTAIRAFNNANSNKLLIIVGPYFTNDPYFRYLNQLIGKRDNIRIIGAIYNRKIIITLRKYCFAYIHPYEVGGTNPSLVEQMKFGRPIIARDIIFHREILSCRGIYFKDENELVKIMMKLEASPTIIVNDKVPQRYLWENIAKKYINVFISLLR